MVIVTKRTFSIMYFEVLYRFVSPLYPAGECHCNMGIPERQENLLQNGSENLFPLKIAKGVSYQLIHS